MLQQLPSLVTHLSESHQTELCMLVQSYLELFNDVSTQTTLLQHDLDVARSKTIKQHAYRVNSTKCKIMSTEVSYLLAHNLAKASCSPCILVP